MGLLSLNYRTILSVALPMMGASFVQSIVLLTASAFLSRYSTDAFAAVGNAGLIFITMHIFVVGISDGTQILISNKIGKRDTDSLGRLLFSSILILSVLVTFLVGFAQFVLPQIIFDYSRHIEIAQAQVNFLSIRTYGLFFSMVMLPIQAYYFAIGKSWVPFIGALLTAIGNIVLDYCLIFGNFGFPEMGIEGSAWAAVISDGLSALFMVFFMFLSKEHIKQQLFKNFKLVKSTFKEIFKISIPIVLQGTVSLSTWAIFFIWLEQMGKFELTVSQNIRTVYFLAFVPVWGFAAATKTYVSQYSGAKKVREIIVVRRRIQLLLLTFMFIIFHGGIFYPETVISWINPQEEFISKSAETLRYISLSMFIFAYFSVFFQTINGIGKTHITFIIEATTVFLYILSAYLLIKVWKVDVKYIWSVEYIYYISMGILSIAYLKYVNWKKEVLNS
ncbi:MAG: MATE family efflux transporter [Crocinitomicaceae bacterium]|nr:MATE family efflux transporter [Crocinitomicaceae bacterium]